MTNDLFTFTLTRSQLQAAISSTLLNTTEILHECDRICDNSTLSDEELVKLVILVREASDELLGLKINLNSIAERLEGERQWVR
jgi:hypothetical protein